MLIQCPDCGSGRRSDGYHREGWYWLECDRRYNPETDTYSPENNWCKLKQLEAKYEELHTACLEYLNHPPANVPARRMFAEIVTGGSCDHLDDDIVTEQLEEITWVRFEAHHGGGHQGHTVEYHPFTYEMNDDNLQCELEDWCNSNFRQAKATADVVESLPLDILEDKIESYQSSVAHREMIIKHLEQMKERLDG